MPSCALAQVAALPYLNESKVHQINLTVDASDWATMLQNYTANTYYKANVTWDGYQVSAGIRQHGSGSRSPIKPNIDVNFAHYTKTQTFQGLPFVILKANNEDVSNLCEWFSMKFYRMMGFAAPREAPVAVSINGQYFGFYTLVEHPDATFAQRNFGETGGYLYEWDSDGSYEFGNLGADPSAYSQYLDVKTDQTTADLQTFCNLVQVVNQSGSDADFIQALSQYIDPKSFLRYAAVENVLSEKDGMVGGIEGMNNFDLYQFQNTTFYQLLPWDKDMTFEGWDRDLMAGFTIAPGINVLAARLIAIPEYKNYYLSQVAAAANLLGGPSGWGFQALSAQYNLIHDAAANDPNKQCMVNGVLQGCGVSDFETDATWMINSFLGNRQSFVDQQLTQYGYQAPAAGPSLIAAAVAGQEAQPGSAQVAPGALVTLSGSGLGATAQAASNPLPRSLGATYVAVDGVRVPIVSTSDGQIEIQMPWDLPLGAVDIVASVAGDASNTYAAQLGAAVPSFLAVVHASSGQLVSSAAPATAGETLTMYMTGLGAVATDIALGAGADPANLIATSELPQVVLGGADVDVLFAGLAPGYPGLYQLNITLPPALPPPGASSLTVTCQGQPTSIPLPLSGQ